MVIRCMSLALYRLHLPARLFSGFERWVLLAMVRMEIVIWNVGRCAVAVADREQHR